MVRSVHLTLLAHTDRDVDLYNVLNRRWAAALNPILSPSPLLLKQTGVGMPLVSSSHPTMHRQTGVGMPLVSSLGA